MMRILVVDDVEDSRELTEAALLSAGYNDVKTTDSGWEALKILDVGRVTDESPSVELVLLDIVMPEIDGIETCARIRNDARYSDLPIIMVTSLDDMDNLANAFIAGATDYVTKPINRVELVARVRAAHKLKAELDRRHERERELLAFLSNWGDRRATLWIDEATGMFVGEVAEAYLTATTKHQSDDTVSILALMPDRFDVYRAAHGVEASQSVLAQIAQAVRRLGATIGIIAAVYRNGTFVVVAPECDASAARELGDTLCSTIAKLRLSNSESIVSDHVTASVAAVTGRVRNGINRMHLLTLAVSKVQEVAAAGGNRMLALAI
jgi:PleD family two-component response regulator